jgi:hypothetical protein
MTTYQRAKTKATALAMAAINEAFAEALAQGGATEALKLVAVLVHGEVLPAPVVLTLERHAGMIRDVAKIA